MLDLLRAAAGAHPDHPAVESVHGRRTYGELLADAERLAAGLQARRLTRVGARLPRIDQMIPLQAGAAWAGVELCGYPVEDGPDELDRLAARLEHGTVVTEAAEDLPGRALTWTELRSGGAGHPTPDPAADPRLLILTTGTTGDRRAAVHAWSRLQDSARSRAGRPDERWLLAYNSSQFAGVALVTHAVASGATLVQPARQRAREGLQAMRQHRVTHASATPTFWRGLLRELGDDPADVPLVQITLGGEAVPGNLVAALRRRFPDARISQVYAATEFGQSGSVRDGRPGLPVSVLDRDDSAAVQLKVVEGELFVRSRSGMLGYWGEPELDPAAWRPTGDLVEIDGERLLFVGRRSEVINVGGVKVHPGAVERLVEQVPGVVAAYAYARPNAVTGQIVALDVVLEPGVDSGQAEDGIRAACAGLAGAARPRSIRFVDEVETRGQKVSRAALSEATR